MLQKVIGYAQETIAREPMQSWLKKSQFGALRHPYSVELMQSDTFIILKGKKPYQDWTTELIAYKDMMEAT